MDQLFDFAIGKPDHALNVVSRDFQVASRRLVTIAAEQFAHQKGIERRDRVEQAQDADIVVGIDIRRAKIAAAKVFKADLADEDRAGAQAQVNGIEGQHDLGGSAALAAEHVSFIGAQCMLDQDRLVQTGIAEKRLAGIVFVAAGRDIDLRQVEHAAGHRRLTQIGETTDIPARLVSLFQACRSIHHNPQPHKRFSSLHATLY